MPNEGITELRAFLETSPPEIRKRVGALLADLQIQHARLEGTYKSLIDRNEGTIVTLHEITGSMIEAAIVGAQAANLYKYGRRQTDVVPGPIDWDQVSNEIAFRLMDQECEVVGVELENRKELGLAPQIS